MKKEQIISDLIKLSQDQPQGFTVDLDLNHVTKGFAVAVMDTQNSFGEEGLRRVVEFAVEHNLNVGGWFSESEQTFYWDAVKVIHIKQEAIGFGNMNHQFAIFDLDNLEVIFL